MKFELVFGVFDKRIVQSIVDSSIVVVATLNFDVPVLNQRQSTNKQTRRRCSRPID